MKTNQDDIFTKFFSCKNLEIGLFMMPNFFFFFSIYYKCIYLQFFIYFCFVEVYIYLFISYFFFLNKL